VLGAAEAHERLGDCALQNEQPERALEEYGLARERLVTLQPLSLAAPAHSRAAPVPPDWGGIEWDRRMADLDWCLGLTNLQLGQGAAAIGHYRQAAATLRLRAAVLERRTHDRKIARLAREAGAGAPAVPDAPDVDADADAGGGDEAEVAQIVELVAEIEARIREVQAADADGSGG